MSNVITYHQCPLCESEQIKPFVDIKDYSNTQETFPLYRCNSCYFVFTQNAPDQASIGPYYKSENYVSHSDTRKGIFFKLYHMARSMMLKSKQKTIEKLMPKKNASLLDIGAATGYFMNHMKEAGFSVSGIETDPDARKFSKDHFGIDSQDPEQFFASDTRTFDVITMWHVLEHVHDLHNYVDELHKRLNDDGVVAIAVPNHNSVDRKFFKEHWAAYDIPVHLWHFEPETITRLFDEHNFKLVKKKGMPFDSFYIAILSYKWKRNPLYLIFGLLYGLVPFISQMFDVDNGSSLTYFFKKK